MDRLLFATYSHQDLLNYRPWAERLHCGLEIHAFADPLVLSLNDGLEGIVDEFSEALVGFEGFLGFHGAFYDMVSASIDPEIVALTLNRYRQNLAIADRLGGQYVVFHANYMGGPSFNLPEYRDGWEKRQVAFWREFAEEAATRGIYVLLENMWADDPRILRNILEAVDNGYFRACLDIAHAALCSFYSLSEWIETLAPYLYCCHLNNHDGLRDRHWPLGEGVIDYRPVLEQLARLSCPPLLTLEMPDAETVASSLEYLGLDL